MKKILTPLVLSILLLNSFVLSQEDMDTAINTLADKISQHMGEKKKTKIAIIPFQDLTTDMVSTLGKYIAEELTTALFNSGKFQIIERNLLNKVLKELKLSQTGAIDPSSAKELGKITGVNAVATGTIQDLRTEVAVNCRLIEVETGEIFAVAKVKIRRSESVVIMMEETEEKIEAKLKAEKEYLEKTKEIESLLKIAVEYMNLGDYVSALKPLEKCIELDPNHGEAYYNLGLVFIKLRDHYSAREIYMKLKSIDPGFAQKLQKHLK